MNERNFAFIDTQNVQLSIRRLGWAIDWHRFRVYLREHYMIERAFLFIGYLKENDWFYEKMKDAGFICVFKPVLEYKDGKIKGNVDAELVLQTMIEFPNFDKAMIVSGDGDFYCLVRYLFGKNKLNLVLAPNIQNCSALLKRIAQKKIQFMDNLSNKIGQRPLLK